MRHRGYRIPVGLRRGGKRTGGFWVGIASKRTFGQPTRSTALRPLGYPGCLVGFACIIHQHGSADAFPELAQTTHESEQVTCRQVICNEPLVANHQVDNLRD